MFIMRSRIEPAELARDNDDLFAAIDYFMPGMTR